MAEFIQFLLEIFWRVIVEFLIVGIFTILGKLFKALKRRLWKSS